MQIKSFKVEKLFGVFTHTIPINIEERITIIHGENGLGKTVILKMIQALLDTNFSELSRHDFYKFTINFEGKEKIVIKKSPPEDPDKLTITKYIGKEKFDDYEYYVIDRDKWRARYRREAYRRGYYENDLDYIVRKFIPHPLEQIGPNKWIDLRTENIISQNELITRYSKYIPSEYTLNIELPEWVSQIGSDVNVSFIETQRLLTKIKSEESQYKSAILEYSKHLADTIKNMRAEATDLASKLDRTYPNRLLKRMRESSNISDTDLQDQLKKLEEKRNLLNDVGLIDLEQEYIEPFHVPYIDKNEDLFKDVLLVYVEDSNKKLEIYRDLTRRIKLFTDIINKRFLYKKIKIDKEKGFIINSTLEDKKIPLTGLSSGEQHELVLFYQLLFVTKSNSLLLLDEPEISLHISWQKEFLNDLKEVIELSDITVLLATHSPDIIGKFWHLTVQLKGVQDSIYE